MNTIDEFLGFDPTDELEGDIDCLFQKKKEENGYAAAVYDLLVDLMLASKTQQNTTSPVHNHIQQKKLAEQSRYLSKHLPFIREKLFS